MQNFYKIDKIDIAQDVNQNNIVILKTLQGKSVYISIGDTEVYSIILALQNKNFERPLTHDLLKYIIKACDGYIDRILITELKNNIFYALMKIEFNNDKEPLNIDCRPSDAIAIGLRFKADIYVHESLLQDDITQAE